MRDGDILVGEEALDPLFVVVAFLLRSIEVVGLPEEDSGAVGDEDLLRLLCLHE